MEIFDVSHVEYDIITQCAAFSWLFLLFSPKKGAKHAFFFKNGSTTCYLWRHIRNRSNRFSQIWNQNVSKGYMHSYWNRQV